MNPKVAGKIKIPAGGSPARVGRLGTIAFGSSMSLPGQYPVSMAAKLELRS